MLRTRIHQMPLCASNFPLQTMHLLTPIITTKHLLTVCIHVSRKTNLKP